MLLWTFFFSSSSSSCSSSFNVGVTRFLSHAEVEEEDLSMQDQSLSNLFVVVIRVRQAAGSGIVCRSVVRAILF